jgi:hypothetical protein
MGQAGRQRAIAHGVSKSDALHHASMYSSCHFFGDVVGRKLNSSTTTAVAPEQPGHEFGRRTTRSREFALFVLHSAFVIASLGGEHRAEECLPCYLDS